MKVIFLDIDGVLNSQQEVIMHARWKKRWGFFGLRERLGILLYRLSPGRFRWKHILLLEYLSDHHDFCPIACSNLQFILDEAPDVKIVVSSVWRNHGSISWLQKLMRRNGIDGSRIIGKTPNVESPRGNQIQAWLNANPGVTEFAIIDDDSDMEHLLPKLVKTSWKEGLMWHKATEVLRMLGVCECRNPEAVECWELWNGLAKMRGESGWCDCYCHGKTEPDAPRRVLRG